MKTKIQIRKITVVQEIEESTKVFEPGDIIVVRGKHYQNRGLYDTHNSPRDLWTEIDPKTGYCKHSFTGPHTWDGKSEFRFKSLTNQNLTREYLSRNTCLIIK